MNEDKRMARIKELWAELNILINEDINERINSYEQEKVKV